MSPKPPKKTAISQKNISYPCDLELLGGRLPIKRLSEQYQLQSPDGNSPRLQKRRTKTKKSNPSEIVFFEEESPKSKTSKKKQYAVELPNCLEQQPPQELPQSL